MGVDGIDLALETEAQEVARGDVTAEAGLSERADHSYAFGVEQSVDNI